MVLKYSKQICLYLRFDLVKKIEKYWHDKGFKNRNKSIIALIEKGLKSDIKDR